MARLKAQYMAHSNYQTPYSIRARESVFAFLFTAKIAMRTGSLLGRPKIRFKKERGKCQSVASVSY